MPRKIAGEGFTLLEVIVAVAIVAIMAGALTPVVFRQLNEARSDATSRELNTIQKGLMDFYDDTGRFPTEAEGLIALVVDPGATNWQGPYVEGGAEALTAAILTDAFGTTYTFDTTPSVTPAGTADVLVASPGVNHRWDSGSLNHPWNLTLDTDDLYVAVSAGPAAREKTSATGGELTNLADACRDYFQDHASFPAAPVDLVGGYLDAGYQNASLVDGWNTAYVFTSLGGAAPSLRIASFGPNRQNNNGGGDDIAVTVSSVPPGRHTTVSELEIAQTALNAQPTLVLAGPWAGGIRAALGLAAAYDQDGWGRTYAVNASSRVVFSAGPDGNPGTVSDNLPPGVGP